MTDHKHAASRLDPLLEQAKYAQSLLSQAMGAIENLIVRIEHAKEADRGE